MNVEVIYQWGVEKKRKNFFLYNIKIEKEDTINSLKKSIKSSKEYHLFR